MARDREKQPEPETRSDCRVESLAQKIFAQMVASCGGVTTEHMANVALDKAATFWQQADKRKQ